MNTFPAVAVAIIASAMLAGCGGSSSGGNNSRSRQDDGRTRQDSPSADARPAPPPRPPTPEEAMELDIAKPLAPAVEHWIADTDLGDAWAQAKENVADLRSRLVADYLARQESGVGETPSSMKLRKDYDRWFAIHDRLKAFILDCRAANTVRDLPEDLAKYFRNWSALRRALLRETPEELDGIEVSLQSVRDDFAALRASGSPTEERLATAESIDARAASILAKSESIRADAGELAARYATDAEVADIAERASDMAADAKALVAKVAKLREELRDAETIRLFEEKAATFEQGAARLDELLSAKAGREADAKALAEAVTEDIRAKSFASIPAHRERLAAIGTAAKEARAAEREIARAVGETAKDFSGALGQKAVRTLRQTLVSEASVARVAAISKRAEATAARYGKNLESALLNLQNSAFKLQDGAAETAAIAEAEKRLARLDALSKRQ